MHPKQTRLAPILCALAATLPLTAVGTVSAEVINLQPKQVFEKLGKIELPAAVPSTSIR